MSDGNVVSDEAILAEVAALVMDAEGFCFAYLDLKARALAKAERIDEKRSAILATVGDSSSPFTGEILDVLAKVESLLAELRA